MVLGASEKIASAFFSDNRPEDPVDIKGVFLKAGLGEDGDWPRTAALHSLTEMAWEPTIRSMGAWIRGR